jgi:cytoskeleton protein RodZ
MDAHTDRVEPSRAIGEVLADRRRSLGLSIDDVAVKLKFMPRQLEALERGSFERLPGPAFVRGMIRSYARALGLDAAPLLARLAPVSTEPVDSLAAFVSKPVPISHRSHGMNALYGTLSVVIAIVIGAVAWEWMMQKLDEDRLTFVKPVESRAAPEPAPMTVAAAQLPSVQEAAPIETAAAPAPEPSRDGSRRIDLKFEREAWVQIRGADGRVLMSRLNPAGSERTVEGRPPFQVVIGNAQHVRLNYEDQPVDLAPHVRSDVARLTLE